MQSVNEHAKRTEKGMAMNCGKSTVHETQSADGLDDKAKTEVRLS